MANSFSDKHTVFISDLGSVNASQLNTSIEGYLRAYSKKFNKPREYWGYWFTNLIGNGVAYVFFDKTEAYYIMIGKNVNGDDFYTEEPNPEYLEWKAKEEDYLSAPLDLSSSISWSDVSDTPPETIKYYVDGPLIRFPNIKLDANQKRLCNKEEIEPTFKTCIVYKPTEGEDRNTLFACGVTSDITEADLIKFFKRFVTSSVYKEPKVTLIKQKAKMEGSMRDNDWRTNKNKKEVYENKVFVKFDRNTTDAMFALIMTKRCKIKNHNVSFKYSRLMGGKGRVASDEDVASAAMMNMYFGK